MNETYDFLFRMMEENWVHARQAEDKRAIISYLVLVLTTATLLVIVLLGITTRILPLAGWLILLGLYGLASNAKLYERSQYHIQRARAFRRKLDNLYPEAQIELLQKQAEAEHIKVYPRLIHLRLNSIWMTMHLLVVLLGCLFVVLCLL